MDSIERIKEALAAPSGPKVDPQRVEDDARAMLRLMAVEIEKAKERPCVTSAHVDWKFRSIPARGAIKSAAKQLEDTGLFSSVVHDEHGIKVVWVD